MPWLLNRASWDTFAAMGQVRQFAAAGLDAAVRRGRRRGGLVIGRRLRRHPDHGRRLTA
jgi:hypothetical protein